MGPLRLWGGGGHPPQQSPPQAPTLFAFRVFSPWAHTAEPIRQWHPTQMGGGVIPPNLVDASPHVQLLPHFPPGVLPRCFINEANPQQKIIFPLWGVTHPKQTQKSRKSFRLSGIQPFGHFPPKERCP